MTGFSGEVGQFTKALPRSVRRHSIRSLIIVTVLLSSVYASTCSVAIARSRHKPIGAHSAEVYDCTAQSPPYSKVFEDGFYQSYGSLGGAPFGDGWEGAYAVIVRQYGAVCDTDTNEGETQNFVSVWAMISAGKPDGGWVQSGYIRHYDSCEHYFAQTFDGGTDLQSRFGSSGCLSNGPDDGYDEDYGPDCGCEYAKVDGNIWLTTSWDPYSVWTYPFSPQFFGEARYQQSDMPGDASSPTQFSDIQGQDAANNAYDGYPCNTLSKYNQWYTRPDGKSWYDAPYGSCPDFEIYTDTAGQ